jgi:serine/threonine-protein kinase
MRVLAADDDEGVLRAVERLLRSWGYEPVTARDGAEAWRVLKRHDAPRIAILDWDMPSMSGLEVCRLLRSTPHGPESYVLMLTARQQKADLIEALEAGADDFVGKPFEPRELQLRLAKGVSFRESKAKTDAAAEGPSPKAGTTLGGKYRLERKIAEGGMASVWLGVHLSLGINVAIKFMKPEVAQLADYGSFEREARAAAQLRNQHIVRVYDHGLTHEGLPYLVMEYLSGESISERVSRRGPMTLTEIVPVIDQVGRALAEAHARGIIHRDVKPENILLVDGGERSGELTAKLVDFGLAKPDWSQNASAALSAGTPAYMSPEHLRGEAPANPALDLWGLAATAFVAVIGVIPFDAAALSDVFRRVCNEPPPVPSLVNPTAPRGFDAWFQRACAREPKDRFQSPAELAAALAVVRDREQTPSAPGLTRNSGTFAQTEPDTGRMAAEITRGTPTRDA